VPTSWYIGLAASLAVAFGLTLCLLWPYLHLPHHDREERRIISPRPASE
jgi:hypothetical protein